MSTRTLDFVVNGKKTTLEVKPNEFLGDVLRGKLGLTGTKIACDEGTCGSCTILLDGKPVYSCITLALDCKGKSIETIEGLSSDHQKLSLLQDAFVKVNSSQCGFCTPGMVMSSLALLRSDIEPRRDEVKRALSGNICRCTDYSRYVEAVLLASKLMNNKKEQEA